MGEDFDINQVPSNWAMCYLAECPRKGDCMRYQVVKYVPEDQHSALCVMPTVLRLTECPRFQPIRKVRMAYGFQNIFSNVLARDIARMRNELIRYMGCRTTYYRYRKGEYPLRPEQQAWISNMFRRYGYTDEIKFDRYKTEYALN